MTTREMFRLAYSTVRRTHSMSEARRAVTLASGGFPIVGNAPILVSLDAHRAWHAREHVAGPATTLERNRLWRRSEVARRRARRSFAAMVARSEAR